MKTKCHLHHCLILFLLLGLLAAWPARAITVLGYWRMGENNPGAAAGGFCTNVVDLLGVRTLTNTPYLSAYPMYTSNVSSAATASTGSQLALQWNGNQYATGSLISNLTDNFAIELWAKTSDTANTKVLAYNGNTSYSGWGIFQNLAAYEALFGGVAIFGAAPAVTNAWTHLALVRASGITKFYVNGALAGFTSLAPNLPAGNFLLGANNLQGELFAGAMDEVRVFTFADGTFNLTNLLYFQNATFALSANNLSTSASAGTNSVTLTVNPSNATWLASANVPWLHLSTNGGTGSATLTFTYDENPYGARLGALLIAGQTYTVSQAAPSYSLNGNYDFYWTGDLFEEPATAGSDSISINVTPNSGLWWVTSYADWIHPTPNGAGSGTISFTYDANTDPGGAARIGQVYVNNYANTLLRFIVVQQAPSSGTGQVTYHFTGKLTAYLPNYVPANASPALKSVQDGDIFHLTMTLVPSPSYIYYGTWGCAVNNIIFSVPSRGLVYKKSFTDLEVLNDNNNPHTLRWDANGVDSTVSMIFWARDFSDTALASGNVPYPLNLSGFHANGFSQITLYNAVGQNPTLFYADLVPQPALSIQKHQTTNTISWVTSDAFYAPQLQTSSSLSSNAVWTDVTNAPLHLGLTNLVSLPSTNTGAHFFRLNVLPPGL